MEKTPTIDDIRNDYTDKFDFFDETPSIVNMMNIACFEIRISRYKLEQKIENIYKVIKEGTIKDTKVIEKYTKQLDEIKASINAIYKKKKEDEEFSDEFLYMMGKKFKERPEDLDTFKRIARSIINDIIEKLIKYEKIFILNNDVLIDIKKKLNINN